MRFWDTSALVPLLVAEDATAAAQEAYDADSVMIVAWTSYVECASGLARAERDHLLSLDETTVAFERLEALCAAWREVELTGAVRDLACRLLRVHRVRAADSLQLASALLAAERRPASLEFVTRDARLETAARREGFPVRRLQEPD